MTSLGRIQHTIASGIVAAVGIWVCWISYTQEPADAFLFPRLISSFFVILALWTFGKALLGLSKAGEGLSGKVFLRLLPGLLVMLVYVFWASKALGFYTATALCFFVQLSLYDPAPHTATMTWLRRIAITAGFVAVMYALFALTLKVFTPREVFF
ncbi:MAG: tripartite tricarboxylate transporter TctB family protein [Pseudomonadota bacterium]